MQRVAICALVSLLAWGLTSFGVPSEAHAGGSVDALTVQVTGAPVGSITSSPLSLSPTFAPTITDYIWRCQSGINTIQLTLAAVTGGTVTVGGNTGSSLTVQESLVENQAVIVIAPSPNNSGGAPVQYWIRCLPHDFPQLSVTKPGAPVGGWYLTGNITSVDGSSPYAVVLDSNGTPVWYRKPSGTSVWNTTLVGNGVIAWISNRNTFSPAFEEFNLLTKETRWLEAPVPPTDLHELEPMSNGDLIMLADPLRSNVDMSALGFSSSATIVDCLIEEVDPNGHMVWQWRASDHISVNESTHPLAGGQAPYDPFHCNSVDSDPASGNVLLSARHTDAVYLIEKSTGKIIWKMGGNSQNQDQAQILIITGDPEGAFHAQHDARFEPNGDISLYDNQSWDASSVARGVEYQIDIGAGTATLVWSYQSPDGQHSYATGSFRRLNGGTDNIIGWGVKPGALFTEVDASGNVLLDVSFPNGELAYRVQKVAPADLDHDLLRATAGLPAFSSTADTDPTATGSGVTLSAIEGASLTGAVASFSDPDSNAQADEYLATIAWGDGSSSAGIITGTVGGPFSVSGTHRYAEAGANVVTVYITDATDPSNKGTVTSTLNVADAALSASCAMTANSLMSFRGTAATFTDADPSATASDYTASIAWGDGSSAPGTVSGPDGGPFTVSGSHAYGSTGKFSVNTTVKDVGGSSASAPCNSLIYAFPSGAVALATGEKNTTNGSTITYRVVPLSNLDSWGGEETSSWKELWQKLAPACGIDWGTITGNGSLTVRRPLPDYMGVIIISRAIESASRSTGITAHIVVVRTNTRRPGRGTVEAQIC